MSATASAWTPALGSERSLLAPFEACRGLLATEIGALELVLRSLRPPASASVCIERKLAWFLIRHAAARKELLEGTHSELREYWTAPPRSLLRLAQGPGTDAAFALLRHQIDTGTIALPQIAVALGASPPACYRDDEARTMPDAGGRFVVYPRALVARARTEAIAAQLAQYHGAESIRRSLWILVATLNAHACRDANGRLARMLWQAVLVRDGVLAAPVLPLGPLVYASEGAFEIAVRRAELFDDWQPLVDLLVLFADFVVRHLDAVSVATEPDA